jgi:hypothetical protein
MSDTGVSCDYCSWKNRSSRYPWHVITKHLAEVHLHPGVSDNFVYGHTVKYGMEREFIVCLTCKGGTASSPLSVVGDRWTSWHDKQAKCRHAHPDAYCRFKALWTAARGSIIAAEKEAAAVALAKAEAEVAAKAAGGVGELWAKYRGNRRLTEYMREVEERMKEEHSLDVDEDDEDPTPFVFDPAEAFERAIAEAMSVRKEVVLTKQKMSEMVVAHDAELTTHRTELLRLGREGTALRETVTDQAGRLLDQSAEVKSLREEVAALRKQLGIKESS